MSTVVMAYEAALGKKGPAVGLHTSLSTCLRRFLWDASYPAGPQPRFPKHTPNL